MIRPCHLRQGQIVLFRLAGKKRRRLGRVEDYHLEGNGLAWVKHLLNAGRQLIVRDCITNHLVYTPIKNVWVPKMRVGWKKEFMIDE